jgi:hypothetical protein
MAAVAELRVLAAPLIVNEGNSRFFEAGPGRFFAAIAVDIHFEDRGVMDQAIDGGEAHGLIREDFAPFAECLVGGYEHRSPLGTGTDQFERTLVSAWSLVA